MKTKPTPFRRVLSGVLSAACVLSGTAFAGATVATTVATTEPIKANAAGTVTTTVDTPFTWDNASVYFLLTDRFYNGDTSNDHSYGRGQNNGQNVSYDTTGAFQGGDFAGITKKINEGYFDELGVDAIWLSAPYEQIHGYCVAGDGDSFAHYSYHGYYVLDYTESDKNFGTKEEFKTLVNTAHNHGIRIVMDIVMNHSGYNTIQDQYEYNFGELKSGWQNYYYAHQNINNTTYHGYVNYEANANPSWSNWWGPDWIRCGLPGYTQGSGDIEGCLAGLPDFKTGSSTQVSLPKVLQTKWSKEGTLSAKQSKYGSSDTVTGYISTWLAEWVKDYGVDGFRCDTAKHVEPSAWAQLKTKCVAALKEWRQNNPSDPAASWTDNFWMTGECFGHKMERSYYYDNGFDSMINFEFAPAVNSSNIPGASSVESTYSRYAGAINSDPTFNVLSYLASHDTTLINGDRKYAGSFLLMLPGAIQIYYGDETNRPKDTSAKANADPGAGHQLRTFMNWSNIDTAVLSHWQKLGQFRRNHFAIGAGSHKQLTAYNSSSGYTFARTYQKGDIDDKVVVTLFAPANASLTIDVSSVWSDGMEITNAYDGTTCKVSGGKVTFNTGANGTILMQEPQGKKGKVLVTHINKDTGETIKTETMMGIIGDSYTAKPLSTEGYRLSNTVGSTTGTYSETDASVTFYYTFDSANYAYIVTKYEDTSGAQIADPDTQVGKIGTTYTTTAKSIKDYEVDTVPANASGTVTAGTTTVTYKYVYVEPTNVRVHYYNSNSWSPVNMYSYDERSGTATEFNGKWPGAAMTDDGEGWFSCDADTEWALVIFNAGFNGPQEPSGGTAATGYECEGEVWIKGGQVYPTGKVNVKYVGSDGTTLGSETIKGMADGTNTYTTTAKTFSGYTLSAQPTNASGKFTEATITVTYNYTKQGTGDTAVTGISVSPSSATVAVGATTTLTATITPSNATNKTVTWSSSNTSIATVTSAGVVKGIAAGTATITAKSNNGKTATATVTVSSNPSTLTNNSSVSASSVAAGSQVTVTGAASGGTKPYKFAYFYKLSTADSWTKASDGYVTSTSVKVTLPDTGTYYILVKALDNANQTAKRQLTVTTTNTGLVNNSKISTAKTTPGTAVTLTGAASGGTKPYTYAYFYKSQDRSSWTRCTDGFVSSTSYKLTISADGTYDVRVDVKDSKGTVKTKTFTLTVEPTVLTNKSTVKATTVLVGNPIVMYGAAVGGTKPYQYAYRYKRATNSNWITIGKSYTTNTSASFTPSGAAEFDIRIDVKDAKGGFVKKYFKVTSQRLTALQNTSTVSATKTNVGTAVTMKGAASGGSLEYFYAFYYKREANAKWISIGTPFGSATSAKFTPEAVTKYDLKVEVMDSNGNVATKTFKLTSTKAVLTNNSKVSATTVSAGGKVTITGVATGGTAPYTYSYYYKLSTKNSYNLIGTANTTATTATLTTAAYATYDIRVIVKDKTGATKAKDLQVVAR